VEVAKPSMPSRDIELRTYNSQLATPLTAISDWIGFGCNTWVRRKREGKALRLQLTAVMHPSLSIDGPAGSVQSTLVRC
jgi:hypothetical protein